MVEVGRVEQRPSRPVRDRKALVDRAGCSGGGDESGGRPDPPGADLPVLAREDEVRGAERSRARRRPDLEAPRDAGEHRAGRASLHHLEGLSADHLEDARAVVDRRLVGLVVGDPPRARRAASEAPGVDEVRVGDLGGARHVGDQVPLVVAGELWPSHSWMRRRLTPASSRCVAQEWRSVCTEARLLLPLSCSAAWKASCTLLLDIGSVERTRSIWLRPSAGKSSTGL